MRFAEITDTKDRGRREARKTKTVVAESLYIGSYIAARLKAARPMGDRFLSVISKTDSPLTKQWHEFVAHKESALAKVNATRKAQKKAQIPSLNYEYDKIEADAPGWKSWKKNHR